MSKPTSKTLSPERLFEAAEAALAGAEEIARRTGHPSPHPADLIGTQNMPEALKGFSRDEMDQACAFLVRLGVFCRAGSDTK